MESEDSREVRITWHPESVTRQERESQFAQTGCVVWFTGLSGSGKSTIANALDRLLFARQARSFVLDGDNIRHGLNAPAALLSDEFGESFGQRFGLGFSPEDRCENIRRIGNVAQLFCAAGIITVTAFVSPYRADRDRVRRMVEERGRKGDFWEVFVDTPLDVCEKRDPKGLYRQARAGKLQGMTGIDAPYEPPSHPELVLQGGHGSPQQLAEQVADRLVEQGVIARR